MGDAELIGYNGFADMNGTVGARGGSHDEGDIVCCFGEDADRLRLVGP
jgi:hypothetical protein